MWLQHTDDQTQSATTRKEVKCEYTTIEQSEVVVTIDNTVKMCAVSQSAKQTASIHGLTTRIITMKMKYFKNECQK